MHQHLARSILSNSALRRPQRRKQMTLCWVVSIRERERTKDNIDLVSYSEWSYLMSVLMAAVLSDSWRQLFSLLVLPYSRAHRFHLAGACLLLPLQHMPATSLPLPPEFSLHLICFIIRYSLMLFGALLHAHFFQAFPVHWLLLLYSHSFA